MKSLVMLLTYHLLFSSPLILIIISGNLPIYDIVLVLVFLPALNKGRTYLKIDSQKTRILNSALCFMIISLLQLTFISTNWKYCLLFTIATLSYITYLYYLLGEIIHGKRKQDNWLILNFISRTTKVIDMILLALYSVRDILII